MGVGWGVREGEKQVPLRFEHVTTCMSVWSPGVSGVWSPNHQTTELPERWGLQLSLYHPPFTSHSHSFSSIIFSVIVMISERGVTLSLTYRTLHIHKNLLPNKISRTSTLPLIITVQCQWLGFVSEQHFPLLSCISIALIP